MSPRAGLDRHTLVIRAAEIADAEGIEAVTLAALAAKLGVRSPSLYNHINGLQDLRTGLAIYGLELLFTCMSNAAEGLNGDAAVHAMGRAYVDFARSRPGLYETTLRAPEQENTELEAAGEHILQFIIQVMKSYQLGEEGELHAVRGLRSILHGFASLDQKGGFGMALDTNESLTRLISTFITGIGNMKSD
ncbi:TetR family transcriptional regulator [Paenibacillus odorifer]|jgi:AcrR family transcriptional regulator|uniref:TetR family transcriptional regulator n=1 Tax=Paenibacillus odorifer TaxID=189426 RepID=A0ABX3GWA6_9BACL|nr:TetR/AcrR family transcriptional regulator [Paenibacillus odorifer]OMD38226.1 TetR family transcriptional regulator [Paenibacillus odorifer]OMD84062.1 TetR family transcriptional regulator [Paenibacillus odorifer]OMD96775.1 TetR family transcriptional regulator [Paenibacillus odorifer]